jgi:hypothetical protein
MKKKTSNYSSERFSLENFNYDDKYDNTGESSFSRDLTIPFDENDVLSIKNYGFRKNLQVEREEEANTDFTGYGPIGYERTDGRIYEDACEALYNSYHVDAADIQVDVNEGIVSLSGEVRSLEMKKLAEYILDHVAGVVDVRNELNVRSEIS